ncbi:hypothetical protein [Miltoncostaea marina]|uniref:hypothetical protein n=1 Tax=Miltoncostaea marina TaxID=2843215 RepID=UPI001C3C2FB4|nr:hypothetical protein [Miltoncostaea marina]
MRRELLGCALAVAAAAAPAWAVQSRAGVALEGGGLTVDAPSVVELPPIVVDGRPVAVRAALGPIGVTDTRPGAPGWTLVAQADPPEDPLGRPLGAPLELVPRRPAGPAALGVETGRPGDLSAARAILAAPPGSGTGRLEVTPVVRVTVPADAPSAVYTTTLVVTVS